MPPVIVHIEVVASVIATVSPVVAVAETLYFAPPTIAVAGAVEVVMTLRCCPTMKFVDVAVAVPSTAVTV
jgi:hypothetical protein